MSERLEALLIGERVLPAAIVREAVARQCVYGGGLDTALLEMGVMSEGALWARLATATGLPVPAPALAEGAEAGDLLREPGLPLSQEQTAGLRVVPVGERDRTLKLLCAEPVAAEEIRLAALRAGYQAKLYVVPEVRLLALRQRIYGEMLPPRFAPILARGMGVGRARKAFLPSDSAKAAKPTKAGTAVPTANPKPGAGPAGSTPAAWSPIAAPAGKAAARAPASIPPAAFISPAASGEPSLVSPAPLRVTIPMGTLAPEPSAVPRTLAPGRGSGAELTPLEQVLDFSQPLLFDSSLEQAIELGEEDLQVVGAERPQADDTVPLTLGDPTEAGDGVPLAEGDYAPSGEGPTDSATEALCRRALDRADKGRILALRALRRRLDHRLAQAFLVDLRATAADETRDRAAITALECLTELRDEIAIPTFIDRLASPTGEVRIAAGQALVMLTARDFADPETWRVWWNDNATRTRAEWLLEALADRDAATRVLSFEELRHLSGDTFGYAPDLPKRKREAARKRWATWWETQRQPVEEYEVSQVQPEA